MPALRLVCFDLDNTLWHVEPVLVRAERETWDWLVAREPRLSIPFDAAWVRDKRARLLRERPEYVRDLTALRRDAMHRTMLDAGVDDATARATAAEAMDFFLHLRNQVELFPGVLDALERVHRRYTLAALSNGNADLRRIGAGRLFDIVLSAESVGAAKPDPAMFERALADAGVAAEQAVHIGDHPEHDVLAARRAGLHAIWANPLALPRPDALPKDIPALDRFDDLDHVLARVEQVAGARRP
jgi:HAD superfamily hydrolase (TIGR01509 family)